MENYLLIRNSKELEDFSTSLGFEKTLFLDQDFVILKSKKDLLKKNKKQTIFVPESEEELRFALEKSPVDIILGVENIHPKDSVHFVRGGLDQVLCKIAQEKNKTIAFSFSELLNSKNLKKQLKRIAFNIRLCKKYKVKVIFSTFAKSKEELRSAKDLEVFFKILGK